MKSFSKFRTVVTVALSVIMSVGLVAAVTYGSTTISTDITTGGNLTVTGTGTFTGLLTASTGLTVTASGLTVTAGGLTVTAGGETITAGGLTVTAGGETITAGGLTVTAGGETITAGGLTVSGATGTSTFATKFGIGSSTPDYNSLFTIGTATERAIFQSPVTGNFGIGTTSPGTAWSVVGAVYISASTTASSTIIIAPPQGNRMGGCIQILGADGLTMYRMYATSSSNAIWQAGSCQSQL